MLEGGAQMKGEALGISENGTESNRVDRITDVELLPGWAGAGTQTHPSADGVLSFHAVPFSLVLSLPW